MEELLKIEGVTVNSLRLIHKYAKEFYDAAPWKNYTFVHCIKMKAFGETRYIMPMGGGRNSCLVGQLHGLIMLDCFEDLKNTLDPSIGADTVVSKKPVVLDFVHEDEADYKAVLFALRHSMSYNVNGYPMLKKFRKFNMTDFKLLEAALASLPMFYNEKLVMKDAYSCEMVTDVCEVRSGASHGKKVMVELTYPAGNVEYDSFGLCNIPEVLETYSNPPDNIVSVRDGVKHYTKLLGPMAVPSRITLEELPTKELKDTLTNHRINIRGCLSRDELIEAGINQRLLVSRRKKRLTMEEMGQMYGLCYCYWYCNSMPTSLKAIELGYLAINKIRSDPLGIRFLMLNICMEIWAYDEALKLMDLYSDDWGTEMFWTNALICYIKKGRDSKKAFRTLKQAAMHNPYVMTYLSGKRKIPEDIDKSKYREEENDAFKYLKIHARHWRPVEGAIEWVRNNYNHISNELKDYVITRGGNVSDLSCTKCKKVKPKLKKCAGCEKVSYCSKDCQRDDWKIHKELCKK